MSETEQADALVQELIDGCKEVIDRVLEKTDDPVVQNSAVSTLGIAIAVATLRSINTQQAAERIASALSMQFAVELGEVLDEVWGGRGMAQ